MNKIKQLFLVASLTFTSFAFAGEFGDHCTTGLSKGALVKTTCEINEVYQGKTYCFGSQAAKEAFLLDPENTIAKASAFYSKNAEPARDKISQADALKQINSKTCDLSNKDAGYLIFNGMDLSHCNMQNISFFGAELMAANLSGANLQGAYLNLARLENANFSKANLTNATIFQAIFDKTNFSEANLTNARLIGTLGNVDLHNANLTNGQLGLDLGNQPMGQMKFDSVGGNFTESNFENANLSVAAFRFGNLRGANLRNTNLYRADLIKADLTGADLTGANLTDAEVDDAIFKDVKGLDTTKGFNTAKGQCIDCAVIANKLEPKIMARADLMTAENPAIKVCNIRGARF